ncbi:MULTISPECIES: rhomboid family intramembrane serine protease [Corynebacterium]|uniref:rhomboid family intramembrane serine protease n=1 Tax=Corynebacterium TaxID=1716 RepID=UPI00066BE570
MTMVRNYIRATPATALIAAVCIIAWLITAVQARTLGTTFYDSPLAADWGLWGPDYPFRPQAALSSEFMHLDAGHLAVNMVMLLLIGREVERALGTALYLAAYLISCLGASAMILTFDFETPTVGASGALFALMAMLVGAYRQRGLDLRAPIALVLANVAYTFLADGVSLWGHLGGLCTGIVLSLFLYRKSPALRWGGVAAVAVVVLALLAQQAGVWG